MKVLLDIDVADRKYRIVETQELGTRAYRYRGDEHVDDLLQEEPWLDIVNTPGGNMILAMAYEIEELRRTSS